MLRCVTGEGQASYGGQRPSKAAREALLSAFCADAPSYIVSAARWTKLPAGLRLLFTAD